MTVKNNKARGYAAEREATEKIKASWPRIYHMERTGLDGGHDLRGPFSIAEIKAVKAGPAWLQSALEQIDSCDDEGKERFIVVKLSRGPGKPVRWLVLTDFDQITEQLHRGTKD